MADLFGNDLGGAAVEPLGVGFDNHSHDTVGPGPACV
jgi:hypothetical protein